MRPLLGLITARRFPCRLHDGLTLLFSDQSQDHELFGHLAYRRHVLAMIFPPAAGSWSAVVRIGLLDRKLLRLDFRKCLFRDVTGNDVELNRYRCDDLAEVDRVQTMSKADTDKLRLEAGVLKESPIMLQKIIADKLSDKVQIMMVPSDGKFFFANDVLHGATPTVAPMPVPNQ